MPAQIAEGVALVTDALSRTTLGPYQLQAAIAAIHDEAAGPGVDRLGADPRAVRAAGIDRAEPDGDAEPRDRARRGAGAACGPAVARSISTTAGRSPDTTGCWPCARICTKWTVTSTRARDGYLAASRRTMSVPEKRYLEAKAHRLTR